MVRPLRYISKGPTVRDELGHKVGAGISLSRHLFGRVRKVCLGEWSTSGDPLGRLGTPRLLSA